MFLEFFNSMGFVRIFCALFERFHEWALGREERNVTFLGVVQLMSDCSIKAVTSCQSFCYYFTNPETPISLNKGNNLKSNWGSYHNLG